MKLSIRRFYKQIAILAPGKEEGSRSAHEIAVLGDREYKESKEYHSDFENATNVTDHVQKVVDFPLVLQSSFIHKEGIAVYQVRLLLIDSNLLLDALAERVEVA